MAAFSKNNVQYTAAKISVASFNPESAKALAIPARTNLVENDGTPDAIAYMNANYTFERMAGFKNVKISDTFENEITDTVDDCDIGDWQKTANISTTVTGDWLTTLDLSAIEILLGYGFYNQSGVLVPADTYTLPADSYELEKTYELPFQNYSASGVIIAPTAVTATSGGVAFTDFQIVKNGVGKFELVIGATGDMTKEFVLTYDHTTLDGQFGGFKFDTIIQPYFIVKIETCPDENGKIDFYYITKASLSGSLDTNFIKSGEVPLSSITLVGAQGGNKYFQKSV